VDKGTVLPKLRPAYYVFNVFNFWLERWLVGWGFTALSVGTLETAMVKGYY